MNEEQVWISETETSLSKWFFPHLPVSHSWNVNLRNMNINIYIHTYSTYIYIYVLYITCVSLISQRISRLPQEKHMVHPLKAGRSHAASRAAFNRWFTRASKDWYLVRCAVNENSLVEERIFYFTGAFYVGNFREWSISSLSIIIPATPSNPSIPYI